MGIDTGKATQPPTQYTKTARTLHWVMAIAILALLFLGEETMGNHNADFLPTLHASAGLVIFLLFCFRVAWRWKHPPPVLENRSRWETVLSRFVHRLLYTAMALLPLTGWLAYTEHVRRSLGARPASWFGFKIPLLNDFGINWHLIHNWGGKVVLALIALHATAAIKHHFYDRDDTLRRML